MRLRLLGSGKGGSLYSATKISLIYLLFRKIGTFIQERSGELCVTHTAIGTLTSLIGVRAFFTWVFQHVRISANLLKEVLLIIPLRLGTIQQTGWCAGKVFCRPIPTKMGTFTGKTANMNFMKVSVFPENDFTCRKRLWLPPINFWLADIGLERV